jgi:hypothetical protein
MTTPIFGHSMSGSSSGSLSCGKAARERVERLRQSLAMLLALDLDTSLEVEHELDRLGFIDAALAASDADDLVIRLPAFAAVRDSQVPPDFPELDHVLRQVENIRDRLRSEIDRHQRDRLDRIREESADLARAAGAVKDRIGSLDPVAIDDAIAQLQAGHEPILDELREQDGFHEFFPSFVERVAQDETLGRGRIISAIDERLRIGPLDYSALDESGSTAASKLVQCWARCNNAQGQQAAEALRAAVQDLMGMLGFTGVAISPDRDLIPRQLRSLRMRCDVPLAQGWFLPPVFGSEAAGQYPVLTAKPEISDAARRRARPARPRPALHPADLRPPRTGAPRDLRAGHAPRQAERPDDRRDDNAFLDELASAAPEGVVVSGGDATLPGGLRPALERRFGADGWTTDSLSCTGTGAPHETLGRILGCAPLGGGNVRRAVHRPRRALGGSGRDAGRAGTLGPLPRKLSDRPPAERGGAIAGLARPCPGGRAPAA